MLDLNLIDLEEVADALASQADYDHRWLFNPDTGEVVFWTVDGGLDGETPIDLDELDLLVIEPLLSQVWYQDMADFVAGLSDLQAQRRLGRAIRGLGAFGHFRSELQEEYPQLLPTWHAFRDVRAQRRSVEWLADNSLIDDTAVTQFMTDHPEPDLP